MTLIDAVPVATGVLAVRGSDARKFLHGQLSQDVLGLATDRVALARLPVIRKSELMERQKGGPEAHRPFGGLTAVETGRLARIFASPGPIYDPDGRRGDWWRMARASCKTRNWQSSATP